MTLIDGRWIAVMDELLTAEECRGFIALLDRPEGLQRIDGGYAEYDRAVYVSAEWAARIWGRVRESLPVELRGDDVYVNDYFRFSKYHPGQSFNVHRDGRNVDASGGAAFMTINIFLNSDFVGGETAFYDRAGEVLRAQPAAGRGAVFDGQILHAGLLVREGYKYLLRTDLMWRRRGGAL